MRLLKILTILVVSVAICATILESDALIQLGLADLGLSWMESYLLPKATVLILAFLLSYLLVHTFEQLGGMKFFTSLAVLVVTISAYLFLNVPYQDDWMAFGTDMSTISEENPVTDHMRQNRPEFDGLICLAMPGCSHCEESFPHLAMLQQRNSDLDLLVFVFSEDSAEVATFYQTSGITSIPFVAVPDPLKSIELCAGSFPTFLYFKDGKIKHRWFNDQFGYAASDVVESRFE